MLPDTRILVFIDLQDFVLATEDDAATFVNQISFKDENGCELKFNAFSGAEGLTRENFTQDECKNGGEGYVPRSADWEAKYVGNKINEVGFQIEKAESQDR